MARPDLTILDVARWIASQGIAPSASTDISIRSACPSCSVSRKPNGTEFSADLVGGEVRVKCHAGCESRDLYLSIREHAGKDRSERQAKPPPSKKPKPPHKPYTKATVEGIDALGKINARGLMRCAGPDGKTPIADRHWRTGKAQREGLDAHLPSLEDESGKRRWWNLPPLDPALLIAHLSKNRSEPRAGIQAIPGRYGLLCVDIDEEGVHAKVAQAIRQATIDDDGHPEGIAPVFEEPSRGGMHLFYHCRASEEEMREFTARGKNRIVAGMEVEVKLLDPMRIVDGKAWAIAAKERAAMEDGEADVCALSLSVFDPVEKRGEQGDFDIPFEFKRKPVEAAKAAFAALGVKIRRVRYGRELQVVWTKEGEIERWARLDDDAEAHLWSEVTRQVSFMEMRKGEDGSHRPHREPVMIPVNRQMQALRAMAHDRFVDPVREAFDALFERVTHDGKERLFRAMELGGMRIDARQRLENGRTLDVSAWAQSYLFLETLRLTLHPGEQRNPLPVLFGRSGREGKSSFGKNILPPELKGYFFDGYSPMMSDQEKGMTFSKYKILEICEGGGHRIKGGGWEIMVRDATREQADARFPYDRSISAVPRHDAQYITTNKAIFPSDYSALHRRFIYVKVITKADVKDKRAWRYLDEPADANDPSKGTKREQIFAEAKALLDAQTEPMTYCHLPEADPEEWEEFNRLQGGTRRTSGSELKDEVAAVLAWLAEKGRDEFSLNSLRAYIVKYRRLRDGETLALIDDESLDHGDRQEMRNIRSGHLEEAIRKFEHRQPPGAHFYWYGKERLEGKLATTARLHRRRKPGIERSPIDEDRSRVAKIASAENSKPRSSRSSRSTRDPRSGEDQATPCNQRENTRRDIRDPHDPRLSLKTHKQGELSGLGPVYGHKRTLSSPAVIDERPR